VCFVLNRTFRRVSVLTNVVFCLKTSCWSFCNFHVGFVWLWTDFSGVQGLTNNVYDNPDITQVVNTIVDALTSSSPCAHYLVGQDAKYSVIWLARLPAFIADFIIKTVFNAPQPQRACLTWLYWKWTLKIFTSAAHLRNMKKTVFLVKFCIRVVANVGSKSFEFPSTPWMKMKSLPPKKTTLLNSLLNVAHNIQKSHTNRPTFFASLVFTYFSWLCWNVPSIIILTIWHKIKYMTYSVYKI